MARFRKLRDLVYFSESDPYKGLRERLQNEDDLVPVRMLRVPLGTKGLLVTPGAPLDIVGGEQDAGWEVYRSWSPLDRNYTVVEVIKP